MPAITAAATHRSLSAGALLAVGGGLALYQMTALVLGPAGNRQLHLSLTISAVDVEDASPAPGVHPALVIGTLAAPTASRAAARALPRPADAPRPTPRPSVAPAVLVTPVDSAAPATGHSDKPKHRHGD